MELSSSLIKMVKRHEGKRLKAYKDTEGYWTIGYGHKLSVWIDSIDDATAEQFLTDDLTLALMSAKRIFYGFDSFSQNRKDALTDFVFNVGAAGAEKFHHMIIAIADNDWNKAADELKTSLWYKEVGIRGPELVGLIRNG
jgi:lysozyme